MANDAICSLNKTAKYISNQIKTSTTDQQYQHIISQHLQIHKKKKNKLQHWKF